MLWSVGNRGRSLKFERGLTNRWSNPDWTSPRRLGRDHNDVYLLHWADRAEHFLGGDVRFRDGARQTPRRVSAEQRGPSALTPPTSVLAFERVVSVPIVLAAMIEPCS